MPDSIWQKSSFSDEGGNNCIELALDEDRIALRESTAPTIIVTTDRTALHAFLRDVKAGRLDRPAR